MKAVEHEVECDPDDRVDADFEDDEVAGYVVASWLELELAVGFVADSVDLLDLIVCSLYGLEEDEVLEFDVEVDTFGFSVHDVVGVAYTVA